MRPYRPSGGPDTTGGATDSDGVAENGKRGSPYGVGDGTSDNLDQQVTVDAGESAQVSLYQFTRTGTPYTSRAGTRSRWR